MINPRLSYAKMNDALAGFPTEELVSLLDSPSIKVGDTASSWLSRRDALDPIYDALCDRRLRTKLGRIRALNTLLLPAREYPKSYDACLLLLHDRSREVACQALWGLCLWSDPACPPQLDRIEHAPDRDLVALAIRAIHADNYRIYLPYFDDCGRWKKPQSNVA